MDKEAFLRELEYLLSGVPGIEQEEALSYYRDYFEEAGPEREAEILAGLGSPARVAAEILGGLSDNREVGEFTETGYHDQRFEEQGNVPDQYAKIIKTGGDETEKTEEAGDSECAGKGAEGQPEKERSETYTGEVEWEGRSGGQGEDWKRRAADAWNTARDSEWGRKAEDAWNSARDSEWGRKAEDAWNSARDSEWGRKAENAWNSARERSGKPVRRRNRNTLLFLLLFICFGIPIAGSIISAGFSVVAAIFGGFFGIFGGLLGLIGAGIGAICAAFAAGITLIATGIYNIAAPAAGIMMIGLGLLAFGGVFLLIILVKWGCTVAVPGVFRTAVEVVRKIVGFFVGIVRRIFGRGGEEC